MFPTLRPFAASRTIYRPISNDGLRYGLKICFKSGRAVYRYGAARQSVPKGVRRAFHIMQNPGLINRVAADYRHLDVGSEQDWADADG